MQIERPARMIVLIASGAFRWLMPAPVLLAVLTNLTALHRIRRVWRATRQVHRRMTEPGLS